MPMLINVSFHAKLFMLTNIKFFSNKFYIYTYIYILLDVISMIV